jgi:hypothetical protein
MASIVRNAARTGSIGAAAAAHRTSIEDGPPSSVRTMAANTAAAAAMKTATERVHAKEVLALPRALEKRVLIVFNFYSDFRTNIYNLCS